MDISREELHNLYWNEELSARQIAHKLRVGHRTVLLKMIAFGIPRRERLEGIKITWYKDAKNKGLETKLTGEERRLLALSIDLEGSIGVYKQKTRRLRYTAAIQVSNTNLELLKYVQALAKTGTISIHRKPYKPNRKKAYLWFTHNLFIVKKLLEEVQPYLIAKKEQALLVLKFCNLRLSNYHKPYDKEEEEIYLKLKELNRRGP